MNERIKAVVRAAVDYERRGWSMDTALLVELRSAVRDAAHALTKEDLAECGVGGGRDKPV